MFKRPALVLAGALRLRRHGVLRPSDVRRRGELPGADDLQRRRLPRALLIREDAMPRLCLALLASAVLVAGCKKSGAAASGEPHPPIPAFKAFWNGTLRAKLQDPAVAAHLDKQVQSTIPRAEREPCRKVTEYFDAELAPGAPIQIFWGSDAATKRDGDCWLLQFYEKNLAHGMRAVLDAKSGEVYFVWFVPPEVTISPHPAARP
jgi:hypothetical protein